MARRMMRALDSFVPETEKGYLDLKKKDVMIADEGYSINEKARKSRRSAVLLIEEIWESDESYVDALIPYFAMKYYDHFASTNKIPHVVDKNEVVQPESLFVIGCLVRAFNERTTDFNLPLFVEKRQVRKYSQDIVAYQEDLISWKRVVFNFNTLTPIAFSDYVVQDLPQEILPHIPRIRCLARQLIVKSMADMEMTAYKPSIVGLSAVAAICSKLFLESDLNTPLAARLNNDLDKVLFQQCLVKIMEWTTGLACNPVEIKETTNVAANTPRNEDVDVGWTELGWTEVVGENGFGYFEALWNSRNII